MAQKRDRAVYYKAWQQKNKEKIKDYSREWYLNNKERVAEQRKTESQIPANIQKKRELRLLRKYGISSAQYAEILSAQGGVCAICKTMPVEGYLCVDHSHLTGARRALLCNSCNMGLGRFKDNPILLIAALDYLTFHGNAAGINLKSVG